MKFVLAALLFVACAQARVHKSHTQLRMVDLHEGMDTRMMYGKEAQEGQFPWQAVLTIFKPDNYEGLCGGSLISDRWVLTAAHCLTKAVKIRVQLGGRNWYNMQYSEYSTEYIPHEQYGTVGGSNVGLVLLPKPVEFSARLQAIRLPSRDYPDVTGRAVVASGYGYTQMGTATHRLRYINMTIITNAECKKLYRSLVVDERVCAVGVPFGLLCAGDDGGPLVDYSPEPTLIGVANLVGYCVYELDVPTGFTRVTSVLDWIHEHTGLETY